MDNNNASEESLARAINGVQDLFLKVVAAFQANELSNDSASATTSLTDSHERFQLWVGSIRAAEDDPNNVSLEWRLREAHDIRDDISSILTDVLEALNDLYAIATGKEISRYQDADTVYLDKKSRSSRISINFRPIDEKQDTLNVVRESIGSLLRLSTLIRKVSPVDQWSEALYKYDGLRSDESMDTRYVGRKFPKLNRPESSWLKLRLGRAITQRRRFIWLCHQIEHHSNEKTDSTEKDLFSGYQGSFSVSGKYIQPSKSRHQQIYTIPEVQRLPANPRFRVPRQSNMLEIDQAPEGSISTSLDSAEGSNNKNSTILTPTYLQFIHDEEELLIPITRYVHENSGKFICSICWTVQAYKSSMEWYRHIYSDLRPYVCSGDKSECTVELFADEDTWFIHELENHRIQWTCSLCQHSPFDTLPPFRIHVEEDHIEIPRSHFKHFAALCQSPVQSISSEECPFCDELRNHSKGTEIEPDRQRTKPTGNIHVSVPDFRHHVSKHMEDLALYALFTSSTILKLPGVLKRTHLSATSAKALVFPDHYVNGPKYSQGHQASFQPNINQSLRVPDRYTLPPPPPYPLPSLRPLRCSTCNRDLADTEKGWRCSRCSTKNHLTSYDRPIPALSGEKPTLVYNPSSFRPDLFEAFFTGNMGLSLQVLFTGEVGLDEDPVKTSNILDSVVSFPHRVFVESPNRLRLRRSGYIRRLIGEDSRPVDDFAILLNECLIITDFATALPENTIVGDTSSMPKIVIRMDFLNLEKPRDVQEKFRILHLGKTSHTISTLQPEHNTWLEDIIHAKKEHSRNYFNWRDPFKLRKILNFPSETTWLSSWQLCSIPRTAMHQCLNDPYEISLKEGLDLFSIEDMLGNISCAGQFNYEGLPIGLLGSDSGLYLLKGHHLELAFKTTGTVKSIIILHEYSIVLVLANRDLVAYSFEDLLSDQDAVSSEGKKSLELIAWRVEFATLWKPGGREYVVYGQNVRGKLNGRIIEPLEDKRTRQRYRWRRKHRHFRQRGSFDIPRHLASSDIISLGDMIGFNEQHNFYLMVFNKKQKLVEQKTVPDRILSDIIRTRTLSQATINMFAISELEYFCCYEDFAIYVDHDGILSRPGVLEFQGKAHSACFRDGHVFLFHYEFIEIIDVQSGYLKQVIHARDVRLLDDGSTNSDGTTVKIIAEHPEEDQRRLILEISSVNNTGSWLY